MNRIVGLLFVILLLVIVGLLGDRGHGNPVYSNRVSVPTIGGGFNPDSRNVEIILREMYKLMVDQLNELREIKERQTKPPEIAQPLDIGRLVGDACVVCHNPKDAAKNGALSLVDADSKVSEQSVEMRRRIRNRINAGSMPPANKGIPPLSAQQKTALLNLWPVQEEGK